jgi:hypothetical protein
MDRVLVGQLHDLVALHHVEADAADAGIRLVVGKEIAAVIGPLGEGGVRVMQVTVEIGAAAAALVHQFAIFRQHALCQDLQALVGLPPAGGAAPVEDRDAHQLTH